MKQDDEKERNKRIEKLIDILSQSGVSKKAKNIDDCLSDESWFNRDQTEDVYQKEQKAWLKKVAEKKNKPAV